MADTDKIVYKGNANENFRETLLHSHQNGQKGKDRHHQVLVRLESKWKLTVAQGNGDRMAALQNQVLIWSHRCALGASDSLLPGEPTSAQVPDLCSSAMRSTEPNASL